MLLPFWYAILLGVVFIIYPILIVICIHRYPPPKFSILSRTISGLGGPDHPKSAKIFNPTVIIMGILTFPMPYFILQVLPLNVLTYIGIVAFFCIPAGLIIVGFFPEDKNTPHMTAAVMTLGGALISNIFLLYPVLISDLSIAITIIQVITLIICIPLAYSAAIQLPSETWESDVKIEKLIENINFWEWAIFIDLQIWIIAFYINLLIL